MADGILFDKACRGYNREQVNAFILKLNTDYQEQLAEKAELLQQQSRELTAEKNISDSLRDENEALKKELTDARENEALMRLQADELAASLRALHTEHAALKRAFDEQAENNADENRAVEAFSNTSDRLCAAAQDRFALVCASREKILSKLTAEKVIISKEELTKLVDRLSADAVEFYKTFTGGDLQ